MRLLWLATSEEMRAMDRRTIEGGLVPSLVLMERAGWGILRSVVRRIPRLHRRRIVIVCGKGNNGGDGLVLARLLRDRGLWPQVLLTAPVEAYSGDAAVNLERARASGLHLIEADEREMRRLRALAPDDLVVDALLGTGLQGAAQGPAANWIREMNASHALVVAVDIPSGVCADSGRVDGEAVQAAWTVTMAEIKRGFLFHPARECVGQVDVVDIGIPDRVRREAGVHTLLSDPGELASWLPRRGGASHKGDWGKLLVVGGSPGLTGALDLAARAALRTGAGLVRIGLPEGLNPILETKNTEAMTIPLTQGEQGQLLASGAEQILSRFGDWDALVLGPGLGRSPEGDRLVLRLLGGWRGPLLIDADGLNALAGWGPDSWVPRARDLRAAGEPGGLVLTPHLGEMARLTGRPIADLAENPVDAAREWSARWGATVVLKGAPSVIAAPDGMVWVNPTGHSGLATGGSGDVLSGIIGAFLGQGLSGPRAAVLGCYLHGLAGELAVTVGGRRSLMPGDLPEHLGEAVALVDRGQAPPGWMWTEVE